MNLVCHKSIARATTGIKIEKKIVRQHLKPEHILNTRFVLVLFLRVVFINKCCEFFLEQKEFSDLFFLISLQHS